MTKKNIYLVKEGNRTLVHSQHIDQNGNILYEKQGEPNEIMETTNLYDPNGILIKETNSQNGTETDYSEYQLDENGMIIRHDLYIGGELYETTQVEFTDNGSIQTTQIEGVETIKSVSVNEEDTVITHEYEHGELQKKVITHDSEIERKEEVYDQNNVLQYTETTYYDTDGNILKNESYSPENNLLWQEIHTYENELLTEIVFKNFQTEVYYTYSYGYDNQGRLIKNEERDGTNTLTNSETIEYDQEGRESKKRINNNGQQLLLEMEYEAI